MCRWKASLAIVPCSEHLPPILYCTLFLGSEWPRLCPSLGRAELVAIPAHHYLRSLLCLSLEWHPTSIIVHHHHWLSTIDPVDGRRPLR